VKEHPHFNLLILISVSLTMSAGFMNAIAIFDLYHYALTHLSGLTSTVSIRVIQGHYSDAMVFLGDIFSYGFGAGFSGFLVAHNKHTLGRHYALGFFIQGCILFIVTHILVTYTDAESRFPCQFMICLACGIQNGMSSTYTSNIMRTTHITGMINDTFMLIGYWLRTRNISADLWRMKVFFPIWLGFLFGSAVGILIYVNMGTWAFIFPAIYAWVWCAILLAMRGLSYPLQKHQVLQQMNKQDTTINKAPQPKEQPKQDPISSIIPIDMGPPIDLTPDVPGEDEDFV